MTFNHLVLIGGGHSNVPLWVARHLFKKKLSYIGFGGHGNQVRDIIHVDDLCEIIFKQIKNFNKTFFKGL